MINICFSSNDKHEVFHVKRVTKESNLQSQFTKDKQSFQFTFWCLSGHHSILLKHRRAVCTNIKIFNKLFLLHLHWMLTRKGIHKYNVVIELHFVVEPWSGRCPLHKYNVVIELHFVVEPWSGRCPLSRGSIALLNGQNRIEHHNRCKQEMRKHFFKIHQFCPLADLCSFLLFSPFPFSVASFHSPPLPRPCRLVPVGREGIGTVRVSDLNCLSTKLPNWVEFIL